MYELNKSPFGKHTRFDLYNPQTGNGFSIVPSAGANVLDIVFGRQGVLDGYTTPADLETGKWGKSSVLFPFPNRLDDGRYNWLDKTYQFPINNAATGNAIHGFVREEAFEVEYVFLGHDSATIRCVLDYLGERPYYPFPFALEIECSIDDTNRFELSVELTNLHLDPIPAGFGWHPYFKLCPTADLHSLQLPRCERVEIDDRMIPSGVLAAYPSFQQLQPVADTVLDTCFLNSKKPGISQLTLVGGKHRLDLRAPASTFPYFQVFTPPHRESIALEPMSCNVDAFNNRQGLIQLEPDKKWRGKMSLQYHNNLINN